MSFRNIVAHLPFCIPWHPQVSLLFFHPHTFSLTNKDCPRPHFNFYIYILYVLYIIYICVYIYMWAVTSFLKQLGTISSGALSFFSPSLHAVLLTSPEHNKYQHDKWKLSSWESSAWLHPWEGFILHSLEEFQCVQFCQFWANSKEKLRKSWTFCVCN